MSTVPLPLRSDEARPKPEDRAAVASPAPSLPLAEMESILAWVRALAVRRMAWLDHLGDAQDPHAIADELELQTTLADLDAPEREQRWAEGEPALRATNRQIEGLASDLRSDTQSPVARCAALLGLADAERDLLHVCLALECDPTLAPLYARLQRNPRRTYATEMLAARLTGRPRRPLLSRGRPLARWEIVEAHEVAPGEPSALRVDPHIVDLACGRLTVDPLLFDSTAYLPPREPRPVWPVEGLAERIRRALDEGLAVRVTVVGARGSGRRTFAGCVAARLGANALAVDTSAVSDPEWPRVYTHAQRQALLFGTALVWHGEALARRRPALPFVAPVQFLIAEPDFAAPREPGMLDLRITMTRLTFAERLALWRRLVPQSAAWPEAEVEVLADRFALQVGDIAAIGERGQLDLSDAQELCRLVTRDKLGELGQLVECPFHREDLVLSESLDLRLDELLFEARERGRFWQSPAAVRLFPRGTGLVALLTGTSGTGKTMTAQVVAAELGLDLFRIDLASSISKYIGETAKNLRRLFARAEEMSAVLLFDEADALFSKRTEVHDSHDRYANTDTNYLLQLIEDFRGIALLSSNKRENIDASFVRRIRYILDFPRPTETERVRIWRRIVAELAGEQALADLGSPIGRLAQRVEMSGAQIKLAVLAGMFAARRSREPLALSHVLHGVSRELAKEGRSISPRERERIERDG